MFSTSHARANFAKSLETTHLQNTVIGFERYGHPVAALVPIDGIRMLAGQGGDVAPEVRAKLMRMARLFVMNLPRAPRAGRRTGAKKAAKKAPPRGRARPKRRVKRKTVGKLR
jgi:hypothetical protein